MSNANVPMRRDNETHVVRCNEEKSGTASDRRIDERSDWLGRRDRILRQLKKGHAHVAPGLSEDRGPALQRGSASQNHGLQGLFG